MLHIPKFDPEIADHLALASLSDTSHDIVAKHHFIKKGFKAMRNEALRILPENLKEIDEIVQKHKREILWLILHRQLKASRVMTIQIYDSVFLVC